MWGITLSTCVKIRIVAATDAARNYTASVAHIFSSAAQQPVIALNNIIELSTVSGGERVILLHIGSKPDEKSIQVPSEFKGRCFHLFAGPMDMEEDYQHRILRCHYGHDLFVNIAILIQIVMLIVKEISELQHEKQTIR